MTHHRLEDIEFRPRNPLLILTLFLFFYGLVFGGVLFTFGIRDLVNTASSSPANWLEVIFIVGNYLLVGVFLLFYVVLSPYRFKFSEEGMRVWTWLGPKFYGWKRARKATLVSHRGGIDLVLNFGGWRMVTVPLHSFRHNKRLFEEIRRRLPVGVAASDRAVALLQED